MSSRRSARVRALALALALAACGRASSPTSSAPPTNAVAVSVPPAEKADAPLSDAEPREPPAESVLVPKTDVSSVNAETKPPASVGATEQVADITVKRLTHRVSATCPGCWMWPRTHWSGLPVTYVESSQGVSGIQADRLLIKDDRSARLEMRRIWVDPQTLGARLAQTTEIELTRASGPSLPADVYASRSDDNDVVVYVATPENIETRQWEYAFAGEERKERWGHPNCDHMLFSLKPLIGGGWTEPIYMRRAKPEGAGEVIEITARRVRNDFYVRARLRRL